MTSHSLENVMPSASHDISEQSHFKLSPTRVVDFEALAVQEKSREKGGSRSKQENEGATSRHSSFRRKGSRRKIHVLPTLVETATGPDSSDRVHRNVQNSLVCPTLDRLSRFTAKQTNKKSPGTSKPKSHSERIDQLLATALDLSQTGQEEVALDRYRKSLHLNGVELFKIKTQLSEIESKHPSTVESIQLRLREDWLKMGLSIGEIRIIMATIHERLGQYNKAISCCNEALHAYERQRCISGLNQTKDTVQELCDKANAMLERFKEAESTVVERKEKRRELFRLQSKAAETKDKDLFKEAELLAMEIKGIEVAGLGTEHPQVARTCTALSDISFELEQREAAIAHAKEALRIYEVSMGNRHPQTGRSLVHLARLYAKNDSDDASVEMYTRALEIFRSLEVETRIIGSILNDVAVISIRNDQVDVAIRCLNNALDFYRSYSASSSSESVALTSDIAVVWGCLGRCCYQSGRYDQAVEAFVSLLDLQRGLRTLHDGYSVDRSGQTYADNPMPPLATDESIAGTLRRLGRALSRAKEFKKARDVLREAVLISRIALARLVASSKGRLNVMLPGKEDELAGNLYSYAEVCFNAADYEEAATSFSESLQLRLFSDAQKEGHRTNLVHCAMCLVGMGNIHVVKGELDDARQVYCDALRYCTAQGIPEDNTVYKMIETKVEEVDSILSINVEEAEQSEAQLGWPT